ncbi:MAG: hypothetical protein M1820_003774 [Bogoriella megaspora]|nr:MAG: hypothetical protein M1820_003774 [Bogoriella megaspora]
MSSNNEKPEDGSVLPQTGASVPAAEPRRSKFAFWKSRSKPANEPPSDGPLTDTEDEEKMRIPKSSFGVLNPKDTDEVPGSILLLSKQSDRNEPLGLRNAPARTSSSSLPSPYPPSMRSRKSSIAETKRTADGKIILEPQPEDSLNDPLNWSVWRRDMALLSIGFYCMLGGGMTPVLAAGFNQVAQQYGINVSRVSLTTGLYMMGLGVGNVIASPTAILFGKRPVYLAGGVLFVVSSIWCAVSPNFASLIVARIVMGIGVSPVECLPSASIAEIYFLHERAYRLGIYTLLLLGGKNLIPLVSAAVINSLNWPWVFYIVAIVVGFGIVLLFFFVPETFWDRTPRPHKRHHKAAGASRHSLTSMFKYGHRKDGSPTATDRKLQKEGLDLEDPAKDSEIARRRQEKKARVGFADEPSNATTEKGEKIDVASSDTTPTLHDVVQVPQIAITSPPHSGESTSKGETSVPVTPEPVAHATRAEEGNDYINAFNISPAKDEEAGHPGLDSAHLARSASAAKSIKSQSSGTPAVYPDQGSARTPMTTLPDGSVPYTSYYRSQPPKSFVDTLKPYSGRLSKDKWWKAAIRPFILFSYPSVLWSTMLYSLSIGWLIVLSESVSVIYRNRDTYNFSSLGTGLVYISPFIGGVLGTAVAGKVSDLIVRWMSRRNDGVYEPEFRLVMTIPVAISTVIGLMGFGWSAQEHDAWIVPTIFFGIISFGCSLGSTTAITFCVDSYRQYAGEALVTLNFSKSELHLSISPQRDSEL